MLPPRPRARVLAGAALAVAAVLTATAGGATAAPDAAPAAAATGNATHFDGLGTPYGGCGIPQDQLETQDFVALNVFDTPGDGSYGTRPVPEADAGKKGAWDNGRNCGRWVQVTIGDFCQGGVNDGQLGQDFCRGGDWVPDAYDGATLTMVVADSCADPNGWCRDDPGHLDLSTGSLTRFTKDGAPVDGMYPDHWNNRSVSWSYVPAPDYTGDLAIAFMQHAKPYWPAISVSHLPNGVHGVEYFDGSGWRSATPNSDMGQSFVISPLTEGGTDYRIRVTDADDALVGGGRVYSFSLPAACGQGDGCPAAYTEADYTAGD